MVIKVDKSEEFINSGKKLISEYDAQPLMDRIEKNDDRELFEMKRKKEFIDEYTKFRGKEENNSSLLLCLNANLSDIQRFECYVQETSCYR